MKAILKHLSIAQILVLILFSAGATLAYKHNTKAKQKNAMILQEFSRISENADRYIFMVTGSWCSACKKSIPYIEKIHEETKIPVYALLYKDTEQKFMSVYKDKNLFKDVIVDSNLIDLLNFKTIPQVYVVKNKKVLHINNSIDNESYHKILEYLKE